MAQLSIKIKTLDSYYIDVVATQATSISQIKTQLAQVHILIGNSAYCIHRSDSYIRDAYSKTPTRSAH